MSFLQKALTLTVCYLTLANAALAQNNAYIIGKVTDYNNVPFDGANVLVNSNKSGGTTNAKGDFILKVASGREFVLDIDHIEAQYPKAIFIPVLQVGDTFKVEVKLIRGIMLDVFEFEQKNSAKGNIFITIDPQTIKIPNPTSDITTYIKTLPGVNSNNELSTQYSVRGGNFDENLVYINGIEIYRPFLVRNSQQEGLSIVNTQMIKSLNFSAGGFDAYYGDKLSSVLDIIYRKPDSFSVGATGSFLGGSAYIEGRTENHAITYLVSGRYRSNQYLLNSLDVEGAYQPQFGDIQSYFTYNWERTSLSFLGYYGSNKFLTIPESQTTKFGTVKEALQIDVYYQGQEVTQYNMALGALQLEIEPNDSLNLNFSVSAYVADERESFDILGQYYLSQLDNDLGSETFGDPKYTLGVGSYLNHARNSLFATIVNFQHRGSYSFNKHKMSWGAKAQKDFITDQLKEWRYVDSAGYSIPRGSPNSIDMEELIVSEIELNSNRLSGYVQDEIELHQPSNAKLNAGVRTNYWDYNNQLLFAPRVNFSFEPNRSHNKMVLESGDSTQKLKKNIKIKGAVGLYQQPPFYRELRDKQGQLVQGVKAQQSAHFLIGAEWNFDLWEREKPFKFFSELYYKQQWDMIPYEIENVRIRYLPEYTSHGYATGVDLQVSGEFIPELPSWFSLSFLTTREDIEGDYYIDEEGVERERGMIKKPTDQRYSFNILFQDFLKRNEKYQVSLNLVFAHGLPFGPPGKPEYRSALRTPPYRRADIGFSKILFNKATDGNKTASTFIKLFENITISAQLFNAFGIRNTVSYLWVKDISNQQYAVPNYLTSRRFNLELSVKF